VHVQGGRPGSRGDHKWGGFKETVDEAVMRVPPSHVNLDQEVRDLIRNVHVFCLLSQLSLGLFGDGWGTWATSQCPSRQSGLIPFVRVTRGFSTLFALGRALAIGAIAGGS
jgi:hypothetical protein